MSKKQERLTGELFKEQQHTTALERMMLSELRLANGGHLQLHQASVERGRMIEAVQDTAANLWGMQMGQGLALQEAQESRQIAEEGFERLDDGIQGVRSGVQGLRGDASQLIRQGDQRLQQGEAAGEQRRLNIRELEQIRVGVESASSQRKSMVRLSQVQLGLDVEQTRQGAEANALLGQANDHLVDIATKGD